MNLNIYISIFFFSFLSLAYSQQSPVTTGGDSKDISGSVAFSIGQVVFHSDTSTDYKINQGVQQPYELFITETETAIELKNIIVFPNPVSNKLIIKKDRLNDNLFYQLISLNGTILLINKIFKDETLIDMELMPSGLYILKIKNLNGDFIIYKVIKNF